MFARAGLVLVVSLFVGGMAFGAGGAEGTGSKAASKAGGTSSTRASADKASTSGKTGEAAETNKTTKTSKSSKAAKAEKSPKARSIPIVITANTMKADRTSKTVVFKGDVEAREDFLLCSDELRMEYEGANDVRKIDAIGNVRIYRASGLARAERAVFDILTGNAVIERCTDTVHGDRITLFLEDDSALVEGLRGGRVKARIIPQSHCSEGKSGGKGSVKDPAKVPAKDPAKDAAKDAATGVIDVKNTHCYGSR
jgi:lipopolysaccharide transport protein LptA